MESIDLLPVVKAYPALSKTYGEVSCIAGIQIAPAPSRWIRLYPLPFRALEETQQFRKYQPIRLRVGTSRGDRRLETRRPDRDSIQTIAEPISTAGGWHQRRRFIEPLMAPSMCEIQRRQARDGTSLGVFRPKRILDIKIQPADVKAEKIQIARAWVAQGSLLDDVDADEKHHQLRELEVVPWTFKYHYECDEPTCARHTMSIIDWEIVATYHHVRRYGNWPDRLKERWIDDLCAADRDTAFFVGNQHQHPASFLVLGVWWPARRPEQLSLADVDS